MKLPDGYTISPGDNTATYVLLYQGRYVAHEWHLAVGHGGAIRRLRKIARQQVRGGVTL